MEVNVAVEEPEAPVLSLSRQSIKIFRFSWEDVSDETEYRLLENADDSSGFTQVARIAADTTNHELEVLLPRRINASYIGLGRERGRPLSLVSLR